VAHDNPFMYYQHMANSHQLPPSSTANVGKTDQAQHQFNRLCLLDCDLAKNIPLQVSLAGKHLRLWRSSPAC
jgi:phospholipase C